MEKTGINIHRSGLSWTQRSNFVPTNQTWKESRRFHKESFCVTLDVWSCQDHAMAMHENGFTHPSFMRLRLNPQVFRLPPVDFLFVINPKRKEGNLTTAPRWYSTEEGSR